METCATAGNNNFDYENLLNIIKDLCLERTRKNLIMVSLNIFNKLNSPCNEIICNRWLPNNTYVVLKEVFRDEIPQLEEYKYFNHENRYYKAINKGVKNGLI